MCERRGKGAYHASYLPWTYTPIYDEPMPNERGRSPLLMLACSHGALETVRYIINEQPALANLHAHDVFGYTPILAAAASLVSCADSEAGIAEPLFDTQAAREQFHRSVKLMDLLLDRGACAGDSIGYETGWDIQHLRPL